MDNQQELIEVSEMEEDIYKEFGYESRQDYLNCLAEDYGVDIGEVMALADLLGPGEDFDGLVVAIEDNL